MKQQIISGILIMLVSALRAQMPQDLSGQWTGLITQQEGSIADHYYFELNLAPLAPDKWSGSSFSFVKYKGGRRYILRLALEAVRNGDTLFFEEKHELEYLNEIPAKTASSYCLKRGKLYWAKDKSGKGMLHGTWEGTEPKSGSRCSPGTIELRRREAPADEIDSLTTVKNGRIVALENRKVKSGHQLFFSGTDLTLKIFDEGKEDGDVISLLYNNRWILKNYKLKNEPRIIKVQASPVRLNNFLICYANSVGKQPPCTTAVIISDGKKEKKVILNADLENCDIVYFEIERQ